MVTNDHFKKSVGRKSFCRSDWHRDCAWLLVPFDHPIKLRKKEGFDSMTKKKLFLILNQELEFDYKYDMQHGTLVPEIKVKTNKGIELLEQGVVDLDRLKEFEQILLIKGNGRRMIVPVFSEETKSFTNVLKQPCLVFKVKGIVKKETVFS